MIKTIFGLILGKKVKRFAFLGGVVLILSFSYFTYKHYTNLVNDRIEAVAEISRLETVNQANTATIEELLLQDEINQKNALELANSLSLANDRVNDLERLLSEHDLEFLALNKPGLIETRINDATENTFFDLNCYTSINSDYCSE